MDTSISLEEAAKRMKNTPLNVLMHIKRGLLCGEEINGSWFVEMTSLESYLLKSENSSSGSVCEQKSCAHKCASCG